MCCFYLCGTGLLRARDNGDVGSSRVCPTKKAGGPWRRRRLWITAQRGRLLPPEFEIAFRFAEGGWGAVFCLALTGPPLDSSLHSDDGMIETLGGFNVLLLWLRFASHCSGVGANNADVDFPR